MEDANKSAQKAIQYEKNGRYDAAIYFYSDAAQTLLELARTKKEFKDYKLVAEGYITRAEILKAQRNSIVSQDIKSKYQLDLERAEFLLYQALDADKEGDSSEATELYMQAVELCLKSQTYCGPQIQKKLRDIASRALDRAEVLKASKINLGNKLESLTISEHSNTESNLLGNRFSKDELAVLSSTSQINGRTYVPFLEVDLKERFAYPVPFSDKHGLLSLEAKQKKHLKAWMRPDEFMQSPKVIEQIDSGTIKQTLVSDCSFIASLAISARYERKFGKQLVTRIIFPQNRLGIPVYNPCGKYMIKLHINGCWRKVIIDDRFPIGEHGEFLCSYSQKKNELWVSLLEKAYMKVMGGYDFPGSNSSIDLNALTGWIPEMISLKRDTTQSRLDQVFEKLFTRFHQGHCLITLATGNMEQSEALRTGLVDCHAYAVLDLRKALGKRLLLVKNPWTHLRWKGRYSEKDTVNWTPELCKLLDYSPSDAQQFDDGVFWIDYESVCRYFNVFYVNWDPAIFSHSYCIHAMWEAGKGPVKDLYSVAENPQYSLEVDNSKGTCAVWILITRHITEKEDFADNKEFITVIVYKSGNKIYLPSDPKPIIDPIRINSPHFLCQLVVKDPGIQKYTLVVAEYEKTRTIYYTLRVYSSAEFKLKKMKDLYIVKKKVCGEWKGKTAGGCGNGLSRETYKNNPIYEVSLENGSDDNAILVDLKGPKQFSVGFEITQVSSVRNKHFGKRESGVFRPGYTVLVLSSVPAGTYNIQPMTFLQNQEGPFFLTVEASCGFTLKRVQ
uniref:Calpain catalytic domain-containing protein n=1 Tax=Syphacia muris TaxID=451379 RepID=A0A0N5AV39_9BILA